MIKKNNYLSIPASSPSVLFYHQMLLLISQNVNKVLNTLTANPITAPWLDTNIYSLIGYPILIVVQHVLENAAILPTQLSHIKLKILSGRAGIKDDKDLFLSQSAPESHDPVLFADIQGLV